MNLFRKIFVTNAVLVFSLSAFANERIVYKASQLSASKVIKGATYKADAIYSNLRTTEGMLSLSSDAKTGKTYISVMVELPKSEAAIPFKSVGVTVPSEVLSFSEGFSFEEIADNKKITVSVENRIVTIYRAQSESLGYEIGIHQKPAATHKIYIDLIKIQLDSKNKPLDVEAQEFTVLGNQAGESYTKEQSGTKISLKF